jgi:hypothetical protein
VCKVLHLPGLLYGILTDAPPIAKGSLMSQPPTPPGSPAQPVPQPQPQPSPQQGMQLPATDAASAPTDGSAAPDAAAGCILGWTPPPWTAGPAEKPALSGGPSGLRRRHFIHRSDVWL